MTKRNKDEINGFREYVANASDSLLRSLLEIADIQHQHPDHANRCWSGSKHNIPFLDVWNILQEERKRRGVV